MIRLLCLLLAISASAAPLRVLIIDGHNNHDWAGTTDCLRATLEATGRFEVTVSTAPRSAFPRVPHRSKPEDADALKAGRAEFAKAQSAANAEFAPRWEAWNPDFSKTDVVVLNYNGLGWRPDVGEAYLEFVEKGGGTVLVHGANNAFRNWEGFNELIGLGWRPAEFGTAIKVNPETGETFAIPDVELEKGGSSGHGSKHAFQVTVRAKNHPIMRGLPPVWMHARDELYHNMRGPAEKLTVLSSAYADPKQRGTGLHEPITWETTYGKGRAIVTSMGHLWPGDMVRGEPESLYCVGFQTIFSRACEYAATGEVTLPIPDGFPGTDDISVVPPHQVNWPRPEPPPNAAAITMKQKKEANPYAMLTPDEQLATFEIAPGYVAELFAAEPDVQEPVLTVWDADGAMYVAEMLGYMQTVNGDNNKARNGRVKRLVDSDGDGRADQVTVFIDTLNQPRCILPLGGGWIAVRESDTMSVLAYRDSDGDGVADQTKTLYDRGPYSRNSPDKSVEHQDSGLMWNIDNHIYISYNMERYRYTRGEWEVEKQPGHWTQWGLTHDDTGDLYWSTNSNPLIQADLHPRYWEIPKRFAKNVPNPPIAMAPPYDPSFMLAHSSCTLNDRGGSAAADRSFTSVCGQSIYRSDKFPHDARGDYFCVDPTIHVVRRAHISMDGELARLQRVSPDGQEFLRSSDINCRFVNTAEGPDGCLYITDMYRGIIQDAPWLNPTARKNISENGLDKNIRHGRIWRIRHKDFQPRTQPPAMSSEPTVALIRHLESPSGWWRDTAQREIILREDRKTIAPHLTTIVRFAENPLGRLHALWTLEGMDAATPELLAIVIKDRDPRLRKAAIQIAESAFADSATFEAIAKPLANDPSPAVAKQLILSLGLMRQQPDAHAVIQQAARRHRDVSAVQIATTLALWGHRELPLIQEIQADKAFPPATNAIWKNSIGNWNRGLKFPDDMDNTERRRITGGELQFFQNCTTCHGADGKGMNVPGTDAMLAPSLADSARIKGHPEQLIKVMLHGLMGPIDGKTYQAGFMAPAAALGITREDRLAELLSYLRFAFGDGASSISHDAVKQVKRAHADRKTPWTDAELKGE